jgi:molecular chaperone DnaK
MASNEITIGIDLGTTYSAVAYIDEFGQPKIIPNDQSERITPSVVYFESNFESKNNVIVGQSAKDQIELSPDLVVSFVKREMGKPKEKVREEENYGTPKPYEFFGRTYSPEEISAFILGKLKKDAETYFQGKEVKNAVITVPAYFNDAEKQATIDAGKIAGLNVLRVLNEPTAAAIAYGMTNASNHSQKVFVFDLGGGTFDVTVLDVIVNGDKKVIDVINTDGDHKLGGKDWDDQIINYIANEFINQYGEDPRMQKEAMADLRIKSEKAKRALSTRDNTMLVIKTEENSLKITLTKEQFEEMTASLMTEVESRCGYVLDKCNPPLNWGQIDTILLAGGSTRMPMIKQMLERISGKTVRTDLLNPDECVAIGAAIQASLTGVEEGISTQKLLGGKVEIRDILTHTLGFIALNGNDEEEVFPILKKGQKVPITNTERFYTVVDNQSSVLVRVTEGESRNPKNVEIIQGATLEMVKLLPKESPIDVTFDMSADGMLTVTAKDVTTGKSIVVKIDRKSNFSDKDLGSAIKNLTSIKIEG